MASVSGSFFEASSCEPAAADSRVGSICRGVRSAGSGRSFPPSWPPSARAPAGPSSACRRTAFETSGRPGSRVEPSRESLRTNWGECSSILRRPRAVKLSQHRMPLRSSCSPVFTASRPQPNARSARRGLRLNTGWQSPPETAAVESPSTSAPPLDRLIAPIPRFSPWSRP